MINSAVYYELTNIMGLYAHYRTAGLGNRIVEIFSPDAELVDETGKTVVGSENIRKYFSEKESCYLSVFGQISEISDDACSARCLWMFLRITCNGSDQMLQEIGRIDQEYKRYGEMMLITKQQQLVRTRMEPVNGMAANDYNARLDIHEDIIPDVSIQNQFNGMENSAEIGDCIEIANIHAKYEQYLHCGNWSEIDRMFAYKEDVSWTVGNTRKKFITENPDYEKEKDGLAHSSEPPYWMGAVYGHDKVIKKGFAGMIPFLPENKGLYCCSDMLLPLVVTNRKTGRAYSSVQAFGGLIVGPVMGQHSPYPLISSLSRWIIEWIKEDGQWKIYHFFWSTLYETVTDSYDPKHRQDWLSTHEDIHNWPKLPEKY